MEIYTPPHASSLIKSEISIQARSQMVSIVERGYKLASESLRHLSLLDWEIGHHHEGYLRPIAISYLFAQEIDQGRLPLRYSIEETVKGRYKYLMLHSNSAKITLSQVATPYVVARPAFFRKKLQFANQGILLFDGEENIQFNDEIYLLLTYSSGGDSPRFVNLGMPNHWNDRINLLNEPRLVGINSTELEQEEKIEKEQLVGFRKFVSEVEKSE
ncbi:hypothetical protein [Cohnella sp. GbtcB17]|uniref:hypothetical protein n=1 Tax=Cohnella sp. GbtcB17 TaxID=2824762 RepID=UPI001C2F89A7|nr:hypothetical protein [Cohnella sp. GbtcB17]